MPLPGKAHRAGKFGTARDRLFADDPVFGAVYARLSALSPDRADQSDLATLSSTTTSNEFDRVIETLKE